MTIIIATPIALIIVFTFIIRLPSDFLLILIIAGAGGLDWRAYYPLESDPVYPVVYRKKGTGDAIIQVESSQK